MKYLSIILLLLLISCNTTPEEQSVKDERDELRAEQNDINGDWVPSKIGIYEYFKSCIEGNEGAEIYPVWFRSIDDVMSGLIFTPKVQNGTTILMIHGYAGNTKGFRKVINHLISRGYTVAALSLPGHELSGGKRGDIRDFNDYGYVVNDYLTLLEGKVPPIEYAIAHSTGCTSLIIYNELYGWNLKKTIFLAPLVRSYGWFPATIARVITDPFIDKVNTNWKGPFAVQSFPFHWFDELIQWNGRVKRYHQQDDTLLILQGDQDKVVSWLYNTRLLSKLYPNSSVEIYKHSDHVRLFQKEPYISNLTTLIDNEFKN